MKKIVYNELLARVEKLERLVNGGPGSGNFGHQGRQGKRGGSGKGYGKALKAEAEAGEVGHFAGRRYTDEVYEEARKPLEDDLKRLSKKKAAGEYPDSNDMARARIDAVGQKISRAKELLGNVHPEEQEKKIKKLEETIKKIKAVAGW